MFLRFLFFWLVGAKQRNSLEFRVCPLQYLGWRRDGGAGALPGGGDDHPSSAPRALSDCSPCADRAGPASNGERFQPGFRLVAARPERCCSGRIVRLGRSPSGAPRPGRLAHEISQPKSILSRGRTRIPQVARPAVRRDAAGRGQQIAGRGRPCVVDGDGHQERGARQYGVPG